MCDKDKGLTVSVPAPKYSYRPTAHFVYKRNTVYVLRAAKITFTSGNTYQRLFVLKYSYYLVVK